MMIRLSDTVKRDHRELDTDYNNLITTPDADAQQEYQNKFVWELARLLVAEEIVINPALESYLRDGQETSDKSLRDHQKIKEHLQQLQDMQPTDVRFIPLIKTLMRALRKHMEDEETIYIPKLESAITPEENERLSISLDRTKRFMPTRAHSKYPNKPPFETVVGLMTAPFDQLMDIFRAWPEEGTPIAPLGSAMG